jgi:hypothetical protein
MTAFLSGVIVASVWNLWTNSALRLAVRKANKRSDKTNQSLDQVRAVKTPATNTEPAPSATDSAESALQKASSTDLVKS